MSAVNQKCTTEEIEEKRRQALEKYNRAQELKKLNLKQNSENRLKLAPGQAEKSLLTNEQKAEIERKRLAAIERAKANKLITPSKADKLTHGKAVAPGKFITQNRPNPYLKPQNQVQNSAAKPVNPLQNSVAKPVNQPQDSAPGKALPPSKAVLTANRTNPYQKPETRVVLPSKPAAPVLVSLEIISNDRFVARTDIYSDSVITEFKKLKTKSYSKF